jgi:hypothetical protein
MKGESIKQNSILDFVLNIGASFGWGNSIPAAVTFTILLIFQPNLHQSIAIEELYISPCGSMTIGQIARWQIHEFSLSVRWRAALRFFQSNKQLTFNVKK